MNKIKSILLFVLSLRTFLKMEYSQKNSKGVIRNYKNLRTGFLSVSSIFYDFDNNNRNNYLSDWSRLRKASRINDRKRIVIDDKLVFHHINEDNKHVKPIVAITQENKLFEVENSMFKELKNRSDLTTLLIGVANGLIIKPYAGGGGSRISKIYYKDGDIYFEGSCKNYEDFQNLVLNNKNADFLMTEIIKQTGPLYDVYPNTLNTIRILTMYDSKTNTPFIATAVQRIGTRKSTVVDNFTAGGISAKIDVETGIIGKGAHHPNGSNLVWYESHPDTGVKFKGVKIANWSEIKGYVLKLSQEYFYIPYIGWDIVPMADGFFILEANSNSDVNLLQLHGGLLKDERVREFYKFHKVIK